MSSSVTVSIRELRSALDRVLAEVERRHGSDIDLGADHYWSVASPAAFDVHADLSNDDVIVGQLSDDLDAMREMLRAEPEECVPWHGLEHLVSCV